MSNVLRFTEEAWAAIEKRRRELCRRPVVFAEVNAGEEPAKNGPVARPAKREATSLPEPLERDVLADVLAACEMHPRIAWAHRFNTGAMEVDGRFVKFAFAGCSDILGQLTDGRFLAIECKRYGKHPTPAQQAFLLNVSRHGGCAFVARSAEDVWKMLSITGSAA